MQKVYSAPRTRALRVVWLLEELGAPYDLVSVTFRPTSDRFFIQDTPTGKIPTLEDGETVIGESGAIVEYLLEQHPGNELAPGPGDPERGEFLQWLHFSESSAFAPIGVVVWLTIYRQDAADHPALVTDARRRVKTTLEQVESHLEDQEYLLRSGFSAADIMLGFTLLAAKSLGLLEPVQTNLATYVGRLIERPAFRRAADRVGGF